MRLIEMFFSIRSGTSAFALHRCGRRALLFPALLAFALPAAAVEKPNAALPGSIEPFFESYCYTCHDAGTAKADLNLEDLTRSIANETDALNWQDILDRLNSGEMPPKDKPQPSADELARVVGALTESLQAAQAMLKDSGGAIALRRLNRREYVATIKELTGVRVDGAGLPDDPSGRFDTIGQNQTLDSRQLDQYFRYGQDVVRMALHWACQPRVEAKTIRKDAANLEKPERAIFELLEKVRIVHETGKHWSEVGLTEAEWNRHNAGTERFPVHPDYGDLREFANYYSDNRDMHHVGRMLTIRGLVPSVGLYMPHDARAHYRLRACAGVVDGVTIRRNVRITVPYGVKGSGLSERHGKPVGSFHVTGSIEEPSIHEITWRPEFSTDFRPEHVRDSFNFVFFLEDRRGGPAHIQLIQHYHVIEPDVPPETILVRWIESEGPFYDPKTPFEELVEAYGVAKADPRALDEKVPEFLRRFAEAAFRSREVSAELIDKLADYYRARRAEGSSSEDAIVDPLAMILVSPGFLYLLEPSQADAANARQLDAISLANRLSYFLWSGPPDAELIELAQNGALHQEEVLAQQVHRMLMNPRAKHFYEGFMSQWMHLKRFDTVGLDSKFLLHRTDAMIRSSKQEPVEFLRILVEENLGATNLVDSDFVAVDGVLASKYGLSEHHSGDGFRKVMLPPDSPRGGLLTQAVFLSMGTMNNRTSPVIRGSLVKDILLNDPPPPPPPNVPELIAAGTDPLPSVRSLVELHQKKAQCASCHARFDFIGLGLENFDPVGMWLDEELVSPAQMAIGIPHHPKKIYPIDASGELPNGETFQDIHGLKAALLRERRKVARSLFEGLFCYGLGRDVSFTDRPVIEQALDDLEPAGFPVREMIVDIVTGEAFRKR